MSEANIYTYTTVRGPGRKDGTLIYILEAETSKGTQTKTQIEKVEKLTENEANMAAVIKALERMRRPSTIKIFTTSEYLLNGLTKWLDEWIAAGWMNARKKPVANRELWEKLAELTAQHEVTITTEHNSYSQWMQLEAERTEKERKSCTKDSENLPRQVKSTKQQ